MWEKDFAVFADFVQTAKVSPTNFSFISPILSANIYAKIHIHSCQKQNHQNFPYIM